MEFSFKDEYLNISYVNFLGGNSFLYNANLLDQYIKKDQFIRYIFFLTHSLCLIRIVERQRVNQCCACHRLVTCRILYILKCI